MNLCWQDGDLRAFVDGELPVDSRQQLAGHLEICPACRERYRELSERAARVYGLIAGLSEVAPVPISPRRPRRHWRLGALPLAAALAIGVVGLPKRGAVEPATTITRVPELAGPAEQLLPVRQPPVVHHATVRRPATNEEFLRLDDDPIETATVVRVSAENGALQAELIIGPDGRAHAIRVVGNQ